MSRDRYLPQEEKPPIPAHRVAFLLGGWCLLVLWLDPTSVFFWTFAVLCFVAGVALRIYYCRP